MSITSDWVMCELERAAREEIHTHLTRDATRWVCGDGISTSDWHADVEQMEWIEKIASAIGVDRAKGIWAEVLLEIRSDLAEEARLVVPGHIVDAWLLGPYHKMIEEAVLNGLRLINRARLGDRDLFDQLGLPELH